MKKILLCNWTHRNNIAGGSESRYMYLKQIFPDAELISCKNLVNKGNTIIKDSREAAKKMDEYCIKRYKNNNNILVIRDAAVGGVLDISHIPQITMFGNPYKSLSEIFDFAKEHWMELVNLQKKSKKTVKIAISGFMKKDMKKIGLIPDKIISNPVDIDFFKSMKNKRELKKKYGIPKNKKIGIWVGSFNNPVKNIGMILKLIHKLDVFWILIVKAKAKTKNKKIKLFYNINKKTMRDLYNCADFFILTSPIEGQGMATLEAMACGTPCIVSYAGYFYDFWDERVGLRIKWNNLSDHINAIKEINNIKTNSRQVIIDRKLDLKTWKEKWEKLIWKL